MSACWMSDARLDASSGRPTLTPRCGHGLHEACYQELLGRDPTRMIRCPKCRARLAFGNEVEPVPLPSYPESETGDSVEAAKAVTSLDPEEMMKLMKRRSALEKKIEQRDPPLDQARVLALRKELDDLNDQFEALRHSHGYPDGEEAPRYESETGGFFAKLGSMFMFPGRSTDNWEDYARGGSGVRRY